VTVRATPAPSAAAAAGTGVTILETARLRLRELAAHDAAFVHDLLNDADFLRYIGDRGVRSHADALRYLDEGPIASYREHGFGLWCVEARVAAPRPLGICGLLRRPGLDHADIGFAFEAAQRGAGFAREAAAAVLAHAFGPLGLPRVLAIVDPANARSIRLVEALGMRYERPVCIAPDKPEISLYAIDAGRIEP
jgi:RimJ/RimL family protein N-acetyltransferase